MRGPAIVWFASLASIAWLVSACAGYEPAPLASGREQAVEIGQQHVDAARMPFAAMQSHVFDPSDGLDIVEVAMLAVTNNPDLRLARADAGVTRAQAFSAGLLPDPQLTLASEKMLNPVAGATTAFSLGLSADVSALLTRSATRAAADADVHEADLNLLWQEWQTVAQARLLFVKRIAQERLGSLLAAQRAVFDDRYQRARQATERGLLTSDAIGPLLAALQEVDRQSGDLDHQRNQTRHDLNALLGVSPDTALQLVGDAVVEPVSDAAAREGLAHAPQSRPDLLALQAGHAAQDERYRTALLAQFPAITLGPTRARDTSNVNTAGFALGLTLPIFNRNRGHIAIEAATRAKLQEAYRLRLDATASDVDRLLAEQASVERQRDASRTTLADLKAAADRAEQAFSARRIDALVATSAQAAWLAKQVEQIGFDEALAEQRIALQTLIGGDLAPSLVPSPSSRGSNP